VSRPKGGERRGGSRPSGPRPLGGRLMDATIDCLVELGYEATTSRAVAERAEVSRGAGTHHFPRRLDLIVGAVDEIARRRIERWSRELEALPRGRARPRGALDVMWEELTSPLAIAGTKLWIAVPAPAARRRDHRRRVPLPSARPRARTARRAPDRDALSAALLAEPFLEHANAIVLFAAVLDGTLHKYGARGYRYILLDAGHAAQNLCLLASERGLPSLCAGGFMDARRTRCSACSKGARPSSTAWAPATLPRCDSRRARDLGLIRRPGPPRRPRHGHLQRPHARGGLRWALGFDVARPLMLQVLSVRRDAGVASRQAGERVLPRGRVRINEAKYVLPVLDEGLVAGSVGTARKK
jgi:AcrR family transcriptional regulator